MVYFRWKLHKNWKTFKLNRWQNFKPNIKQNVTYLKIWGKVVVNSLNFYLCFKEPFSYQTSGTDDGISFWISCFKAVRALTQLEIITGTNTIQAFFLLVGEPITYTYYYEKNQGP